MQTVPAFGRERVAAKLIVAGHAPDVRGDAVLFAQNLLGAQGLVEYWTAAEKLQRRLAAGGRLVLIEPGQDAFAAALRHRRHLIIFVVNAEVVEQIFALLIHAANPVLNDYAQLVGEGRVVGGARGNGAP